MYIYIYISIPLKPYFKGFCWKHITWISPSHRHERTVTGNDMLEAMQTD